MWPDGFYGLSKAFGENPARLYFDRWGIETASLRIGSSFPEPIHRRMLSSWLAYDDLERLVSAALTAPRVGHSVIHGVSDNLCRWWNSDSASHIGFKQQQSSEPFTAAVEARAQPADPASPVVRYQGGNFVAEGPHG